MLLNGWPGQLLVVLHFLGCQAWEWTHLITGEHAVFEYGNQLDVIGQTTRCKSMGTACNMTLVTDALQNTPHDIGKIGRHSQS